MCFETLQSLNVASCFEKQTHSWAKIENLCKSYVIFDVFLVITDKTSKENIKKTVQTDCFLIIHYLKKQLQIQKQVITRPKQTTSSGHGSGPGRGLGAGLDCGDVVRHGHFDHAAHWPQDDLRRCSGGKRCDTNISVEKFHAVHIVKTEIQRIWIYCIVYVFICF